MSALLGQVANSQDSTIVRKGGRHLGLDSQARELASTLVLQAPGIEALGDIVVLCVDVNAAVIFLRAGAPGCGAAQSSTNVDALVGARGRMVQLAPAV